MNTEQTNKAIGKGMLSLIMLGVGVGLFGLIGLPILLYWQLGTLEPNNLRQIACGSICLLPVIMFASAGYSFALYKANRKGQDNAIQFASQAWREIAGGVFKVGQARQASQPRPHSPMPVYPGFVMPMQMLGQPGQQPGGMLIEQQQLPGDLYE